MAEALVLPQAQTQDQSQAQTQDQSQAQSRTPSRTVTQLRPGYAARFACIGGACEDTCCSGWAVPVDAATHARYQALAANGSQLGAQIITNIDVAPAAEANANEGRPIFARIRMDSNNQCPLLTPERLCAIQKEAGEEFLSHTCATYPRVVSTVDGVKETSLCLSCPEAARVVLLGPALPGPELELAVNVAEMPTPSSDRSPAAHFWAIRAAAISLLRNRAYSIWQRMFLLGLLARRLDSVAAGDIPLSIPAQLADLASAVASGTLRAAMDSLPADREAQLDVVLRLAGMMLHRSNVRPRFVETVQAFTAGIGNGPGSTLSSLAAHYAAADARYLEPFLRRNPHVMENYLINTLFRCQFPLGKQMPGAAPPPALATQFAQLAAQFVLMRGLLTGIAGTHREAFSGAHIVTTVQAASKHFEHHPEFLALAYNLLRESGMDGARGIAILLRNEGAGVPPARPASAEISAPGLPA